MGGALQAIARSSPARGARMERRGGGATKGSRGGGKNVLGEKVVVVGGGVFMKRDRVTVPTHEASKRDARENSSTVHMWSVGVSLCGGH